MTINWFAPIDEAAQMAAFLAGSAKVIIWSHETHGPAAPESGAEVRRYDLSAMPWVEMNAAELTFYRLGHDADSYGPIWQVAQQHPGVIVLDDLNLQALFGGLTKRGALSRAEYLEMMEFHHPEHGRLLAEAFLAGTTSAEEIGGECPLTGAALENALGVIVRREEDLAQLASGWDLPVQLWPPREDDENGLTSMIEAIEAMRPQAAARRVAGEAGRAMKPWFSHRSARVLLPRVAQRIEELFDPAPETGRQAEVSNAKR